MCYILCSYCSIYSVIRLKLNNSRLFCSMWAIFPKYLCIELLIGNNVLKNYSLLKCYSMCQKLHNRHLISIFFIIIIYKSNFNWEFENSCISKLKCFFGLHLLSHFPVRNIRTQNMDLSNKEAHSGVCCVNMTGSYSMSIRVINGLSMKYHNTLSPQNTCVGTLGIANQVSSLWEEDRVLHALPAWMAKELYLAA